MTESNRETIVVRAARHEDLPRVWELLLGLANYERLPVAGSRERLGELLFGGKASLEALVAEREGRLIGYALVFPTYSSFATVTRLWLEDLFVEPDQRGSGAGLALMREVARMAVARGYERVQWDVLDWNEPAMEFYRSLEAAPEHADWIQFGIQGAALEKLAAGER